MKRFSNCPVCGDALLNQDHGILTYQSCKTHTTHQLQMITGSNDEVQKLSILVGFEPTIWATWHLLSQEIRVHNYNKTISKIIGDPLPWFEPDLSDYNKLVDKIRTYILFS